MVLNSKEEFMDLYLAVRAKSGYLTFTQKYPDDFLPWISSGKYQHLFSFFRSKSDLNFLPYLKSKYESSHSIEIVHRESSLEDTIYVKPNFSSFSFSILCCNDSSLCSEMEDLIFDMEKTKFLNGRLQRYSATGIYQIVNPNGIYPLQEGEKLFVDGSIEDLGNQKYFIEHSLFTASLQFADEKLGEMKVSSCYRENDSYVDQIIDRILSYNYCSISHGDEASPYFQVVQKGKIYQYKKF